LLEDKVAKSDLQYLLSNKVSVEELGKVLESKANMHEVGMEVQAMSSKMDEVFKDLNKRVNNCAL